MRMTDWQQFRMNSGSCVITSSVFPLAASFWRVAAKSNLNAAKEQCPLLTVLQAADGLASALLEVTK